MTTACDGGVNFVTHDVSYNKWLPSVAARYRLQRNWSVYAHFGEGSRFALESPAMPGVTRSFAGFPAAVAELADARVFAGIHFRTACEVARVTGDEVAEYVLEHSMRRLRGN